MTKLLTALAVLLSLTSFAQAQDLSVLTANVSGTVTFSSMEVGCKKLDDVMDQSSAFRTASKKTGACEFISKDKEYQVLKIASASKAWPTTHAALCISQDRSGSCLWVVAKKSKLTSDVVEAVHRYRARP